MFFDPDHKILFVHNPKAAGLAVRQALSITLGEDGNTAGSQFKIKHDHDNRVSTHSFASRLRTHPRIFEHFDECFKFGIVRNPWERCVSFWMYSHEVTGGQTMLRHGLSNQPDFRKDRQCNNVVREGFDYWLTRWVDKWEWNPWHYTGEKGVGAIFDHNQIEWFQSGKHIIVDKIYRMDQLPKLASDLEARIGRPIKIRKHNATDHAPYRSFYTEASREWVRRRFDADIQRFKFKF